jgi:hypothetical protein
VIGEARGKCHGRHSFARPILSGGLRLSIGRVKKTNDRDGSVGKQARGLDWKMTAKQHQMGAGLTSSVADHGANHGTSHGASREANLGDASPEIDSPALDQKALDQKTLDQKTLDQKTMGQQAAAERRAKHAANQRARDQDKERRRAEALRANLHRRKAQARNRRDQDDA